MCAIGAASTIAVKWRQCCNLSCKLTNLKQLASGSSFVTLILTILRFNEPCDMWWVMGVHLQIITILIWCATGGGVTETDQLLREVERLRADLAAAHSLLCSEDQRYIERIAELERVNAKLAAEIERLTQERE